MIVDKFAGIKTALVGSTGITAVELVEPITSSLPQEVGGICQIVVQLIIGIATIVGLFKKSRKY